MAKRITFVSFVSLQVERYLYYGYGKALSRVILIELERDKIVLMILKKTFHDYKQTLIHIISQLYQSEGS